MPINSRSLRSGRRGDHPWRPDEPHWQRVLQLRREGASPRAPEWKELLATLQRTALATAACILQSPRYQGVDCDAHDVTQQFFTLILRTGLNRHQPGKPFFPYAYVTLVHLCRTQGRRAQKRTMKQIAVDLAAGESPSWRRAARNESRRRLSHALHRLSKEERALVADKYWRGFSSAEIGARRGHTAAQVDQKMFQIRTKLRTLLSPDDRPD